ncbi:hypothetical protein BKA70DRAFT_1227564 [Coprinopsis sp. MPI-PUGE-AT-0042]|nr:hypothetical protein BKA70DRAFT_1227564 [Coprinopsis sp. MPI-PUGE-AT-0042]
MSQESYAVNFLSYTLKAGDFRYYPWNLGSYTLATVNPEDPSSYASFYASLGWRTPRLSPERQRCALADLWGDYSVKALKRERDLGGGDDAEGLKQKSYYTISSMSG